MNQAFNATSKMLLTNLTIETTSEPEVVYNKK